MSEPETRPCKFGGNVECLSSDRGRADCYVCNAVRAALSTLSRLSREHFELTSARDKLRAENERLVSRLGAARRERDVVIQERDRACHALMLLKQKQ